MVSTLNGILYNLLRGKPCQALASDMRVRTSADGAYVYPDLTVVCSQIEHADGTFDTLTNPTVVFEVLSPSTERNDRGIKAEHYWDMP
ncbi:Uma2 family endonuclease, partial [Acinetobacter baumannii]